MNTLFEYSEAILALYAIAQVIARVYPTPKITQTVTLWGKVMNILFSASKVRKGTKIY